MAKPPSKPRKGAETPDVERHDHVYFRHRGGPKTGRVLSRGEHGCVIEADGERHKVKWEHFLGHKVRVQPKVRVVDRGEDGFLVENNAGHRRFVRDPMGVVDPAPMAKSLLPAVLLIGEPTALLKAAGREIKNRPGLVLQPVTDSRGHQTKRWKKTAAGAHKDRRGKHNVEAGHHVKFHAGDFKGEGHVAGEPGEHGVHVKDKSGRQHPVRYSEITEHAASEKPAGGGGGKGGGGVQGDAFKAADFAKQHDDANVTPESILSGFDDKTRQLVAAATERLKDLQETQKRFKQGDEYIAERQKVHRQIWDEYMSDAKRAAATPAAGEKPTLTILGGRGGSGKSKLNGLAYDESKAIKIDTDEIKARLPEYKGWNAFEVHEESSDIADAIIRDAMNMGLNVVLDGTLKTATTALGRVGEFKENGYRIEAHYMHLPRQEAAKRAVGRFLTSKGDGSGRFVPLDVILKNTTNEASFDQVRQQADAWSFYDNSGEKGEAPKLIAKSGTKSSEGA